MVVRHFHLNNGLNGNKITIGIIIFELLLKAYSEADISFLPILKTFYLKMYHEGPKAYYEEEKKRLEMS